MPPLYMCNRHDVTRPFGEEQCSSRPSSRQGSGFVTIVNTNSEKKRDKFCLTTFRNTWHVLAEFSAYRAPRVLTTPIAEQQTDRNFAFKSARFGRFGSGSKTFRLPAAQFCVAVPLPCCSLQTIPMRFVHTPSLYILRREARAVLGLRTKDSCAAMMKLFHSRHSI